MSLSGLAQYCSDPHRARTQRVSPGAKYSHPPGAALAVDGEIWPNSRGILLDAELLVASHAQAPLSLHVSFTTDHGAESP